MVIKLEEHFTPTVKLRLIEVKQFEIVSFKVSECLVMRTKFV